ncbi:hypothetical protein Cob_v002304 [Colletotrichum orbiculare MAFF 240422]|uniref:Uncharacterized protein n=1 Tax=Colletotrichum orbiculare (strain 104-T / ATCC 96160 / CBS 514.97 / LARS 414 / MAFF 240422) TaxID=1213857 RepID=A0A484G4V9_COLOR|nr:hypothetical protein Cob_v002304 [Colletotrichum orbiculare MAFF 240422]
MQPSRPKWNGWQPSPARANFTEPPSKLRGAVELRMAPVTHLISLTLHTTLGHADLRRSDVCCNRNRLPRPRTDQKWCLPHLDSVVFWSRGKWILFFGLEEASIGVNPGLRRLSYSTLVTFALKPGETGTRIREHELSKSRRKCRCNTDAVTVVEQLDTSTWSRHLDRR